MKIFIHYIAQIVQSGNNSNYPNMDSKRKIMIIIIIIIIKTCHKVYSCRIIN